MSMLFLKLIVIGDYVVSPEIILTGRLVSELGKDPVEK